MTQDRHIARPGTASNATVFAFALAAGMVVGCYNSPGLPVGQACTQNSECASNRCEQGQCVAAQPDMVAQQRCSPPGSACGTNGVCRLNGTCAEPVIPPPVDMGGATGQDGFLVLVSDCDTPANLRLQNGGYGGLDGWGFVQPNDGSPIRVQIIDGTNFNTDMKTPSNLRPGVCALLLRWPGMGNTPPTPPPSGAIANLPRVGMTDVPAYWLDTGPTAFGWAHDNRHRR